MNLNIPRILVSSALGAIVAFVVAQQAAGAQMSPAQRQEMMEHYERATRAYDVQKYQEAVAEYQKAYEIGGDPAMLYNVAQAYRLGDQLTEALHTYRRYLQRSPTARNREDVERKIADLEQTIEARRKAAEAAAQAKQAAEAAQPPPTAAPPLVPPPTPAIPAESGVNGLRVAGIAVLSVGAAALVTTGVACYLGWKKGDDLNKASQNEQRFDPDVQSSGKTWNTVAYASAIGGGVLAVVGTVLIVVAGSSEPSPEGVTTTARLQPLIGGPGSGGLWGMRAAFTF
ncbi:MAG TPA: tetratricopeptide repeat protein [Polyangia bacterium]